MIDLRNDINRKEIPKSKNPKKVADIVEKSPDFNKQQNGKGLPSDLAHVAKVSDHTDIKVLMSWQILQRLSTALAQEKAGDTSKNLLNKTRQIIYYVYRAKE